MNDPKELSEAPASTPEPAEATAETTAAEAPAPAPEAPDAPAAPAPEPETAEAPAAEAPAAEGTLPGGQEGAPFVPDQSRTGARAEAAAPTAPEDPGGSAHEPAEDESFEEAFDKSGPGAARRVDPSEEPPRPAKREKTPAGLWCDFLEGLGPLPSAADDARRQLVERLREQDERA